VRLHELAPLQARAELLHRAGERDLRRGCRGADVEALQIRLAGFRGTVPDGGIRSG
jgi:hypothetical protein